MKKSLKIISIVGLCLGLFGILIACSKEGDPGFFSYQGLSDLLASFTFGDKIVEMLDGIVNGGLLITSIFVLVAFLSLIGLFACFKKKFLLFLLIVLIVVVGGIVVLYFFDKPTELFFLFMR